MISLRIAALVVLAHVIMLAQVLGMLALLPSLGQALSVVLCALAITKTALYGVALRKLVLKVISQSGEFHSFLVVLAALMFVTIASFAADFTVALYLDPASIAAMNPADPLPVTLFNAWYFSVLNFSFFGIADIIPQTVLTRFILALESLASFLTLIFILADFAELRASVRRASSEDYTKAIAPKP